MRFGFKVVFTLMTTWIFITSTAEYATTIMAVWIPYHLLISR